MTMSYLGAPAGAIVADVLYAVVWLPILLRSGWLVRPRNFRLLGLPFATLLGFDVFAAGAAVLLFSTVDDQIRTSLEEAVGSWLSWAVVGFVGAPLVARFFSGGIVQRVQDSLLTALEPEQRSQAQTLDGQEQYTNAREMLTARLKEVIVEMGRTRTAAEYAMACEAVLDSIRANDRPRDVVAILVQAVRDRIEDIDTSKRAEVVRRVDNYIAAVDGNVEDVFAVDAYAGLTRSFLESLGELRVFSPALGCAQTLSIQTQGRA